MTGLLRTSDTPCYIYNDLKFASLALYTSNMTGPRCRRPKRASRRFRNELLLKVSTTAERERALLICCRCSNVQSYKQLIVVAFLLELFDRRRCDTRRGGRSGKLPRGNTPAQYAAALCQTWRRNPRFNCLWDGVVEPRGIEPLTFALRTRRSPS